MLGQVLKLGPVREGVVPAIGACRVHCSGQDGGCRRGARESGEWFVGTARSGQGQVCASQLALGMGAYDGRDVRARHGVDIRLCKAVGAV